MNFIKFAKIHKNLSRDRRDSITIAETSDHDHSIRNNLLYNRIQRIISFIRTDFEKKLEIVPKTLILSGARLAADCRESVLLIEHNSSSISYVKWRGRPSTWLPRRKLIEEERSRIRCCSEANHTLNVMKIIEL